MVPEVTERVDRIEAKLDRSAEAHRRAIEKIEKRMEESDRRHKAAVARDRLLDAREREHYEAAMARMDRSDKKLDRLQKLVEIGWKALMSQAAEARKARADTAAFKAEMRAFRKTLSNGYSGSNGGGRH
jgi:hypothetical protein